MSSHENAFQGRELSQRRRALSEKGNALFWDCVSTFSAGLAWLHQQLDELFSPSTNISLDELFCKHGKIKSLLFSYKKNSGAFMAYLGCVNKKDSEREAVAHTLIAKTVLSKAHAIPGGYAVLEQSLSKCYSSTPQRSDVSSIKTLSRQSRVLSRLLSIPKLRWPWPVVTLNLILREAKQIWNAPGPKPCWNRQI